MNTFIASLPAGPLDLVGDIHGEWDALVALLHHLGYGADGQHPRGRRLVLLGDVVDRGPDVPAVLDWCQLLLATGRGQMVLGNHEINLLLDEAKPGSGWYFDERADRDGRDFGPWRRYPPAKRAALRSFLAGQPLILQRPDLRVVHAAWLPEAVAALGQASGRDLVAAHRQWERALDANARNQPWYADWQRELAQPLAREDAEQTPAPRPATAARDAYYSSGNPIRALTCGNEEPSPAPHFAGGRWRFVQRASWWQHYDEAPAVVIGHYWRRWDGSNPLFPGPPQSWCGPRHNVFCCDYSVGARWQERRAGVSPSRCRLAALRWPERTLVFDDGQQLPTI